MPISYRSPPGGTSTEIQVRSLTGVHYGVPGTSYVVGTDTLTLKGLTLTTTAVGVSVPVTVTVAGTQLTLTYSSGITTTIATDASGYTTIVPSGGLAEIKKTAAGVCRVTAYAAGNTINDAASIYAKTTAGGVAFTAYLTAAPYALCGIDSGLLYLLFNCANVAGTFRFNIANNEYARLTTTGFGIGCTPSARLHVRSTTEQQRWDYDAADYLNLTIAANGLGTLSGGSAAATHGLKIGTAATFLFSVWGATPIVQPVNTTAIDTLLANVGLRASGGVANFATSITLPDNVSLTLGTDNDATITYDGTNLVINPKVVGSGYLSVLGAIYTPGYLTNRPALYYGKYTGPGAPKPTPVERGGVLGFSMPIYAGDDEELFFRDHVPGRWNGASDIVVEAKCYIDTANTAGEKFQFQLSWYNSSFSGVTIAATTTDVKTETTIVSGTQYAAYTVSFTVDWDVVTPDIAAGDMLAMRLRRIAVEAGGDECEGEIVVADITVKYQVNKVYKAA